MATTGTAWRRLPNLVSLARLVLVMPIAWALVRADYGLALGLFLLAAASDGLDGWLARRFGWASASGAVLDPIADKVVMATVYITLGLLGHIPWWLMVLVLGRDVVIMAGAGLYRLLFGPFTAEVTWLGKVNTMLQFAYPLLVLFGLWLDPAAMAAQLASWMTAGAWLVGLVTVASGAHYVAVWSQRALAARAQTPDRPGAQSTDRRDPMRDDR